MSSSSRSSRSSNKATLTRILLLLLLACILALTASINCLEEDNGNVNAVDALSPLKLLVFSKTNGFRHATAIMAAQAMFRTLSKTNNYNVTFSENSEAEFGANVTPQKLAAKYDVIVLLHNTGPDLWYTDTQKSNLQKYMEEQAKGVVGIHAASDGSNWNWYIKNLIGASFTKHPPPQEAVITIEKPDHYIMKNSVAILKGNQWKRTDEWYEFNRNVRNNAPELKNLVVLANVDEKTYTGGGMGTDHPLIWCHEMNVPDQTKPGRVFYTALGHPDSSYTEPAYVAHIVSGIEWAARRDAIVPPPVSHSSNNEPPPPMPHTSGAQSIPHPEVSNSDHVPIPSPSHPRGQSSQPPVGPSPPARHSSAVVVPRESSNEISEPSGASAIAESNITVLIKFIFAAVAALGIAFLCM